MRFINAAAFAAGALVMLAPDPAAAATVEVVSGSGQRSFALPFFGGTAGQSFTAVDSSLTSFGFQFNALNPGNANSAFTFTLRAGESLLGAVLATRSFTLPSAIATRTPVWFDLDITGTAVTIGQRYTAVLTTANTRNGLVLGPDININTGVPLSGDAYAGGRALFAVAPYPNCTTTANCDLNFRVSGVTAAAAVPETASWALMIAGFGLTGGALRRRARNTHRLV